MSMIMQWDAVDPVTADRLRAMDADAFIDWLEDADGRISFDVDKAWHAVHFALTGDAWSPEGPMGSVVLGGEEFGEDIGYGPPRWLAAEAVAAASATLAGLTPAEFASRLDFGAMARNDIYPQIWDRDPAAEQLVEFVVGGYETIRNGYARAAAGSHGFVISLL